MAPSVKWLCGRISPRRVAKPTATLQSYLLRHLSSGSFVAAGAVSGAPPAPSPLSRHRRRQVSVAAAIALATGLAEGSHEVGYTYAALS